MLLIALLSVVALLADGPVSEARELVAKKKWDDAYSVLAEHLKRDPETAGITVIACSAFATSDYKERALRAGCEGYITKPIEPNRLVEQVTRLILNSKIKKKMCHAS